MDVIRNLARAALRNRRVADAARKVYYSGRTMLPKRDIFAHFDGLTGYPTGEPTDQYRYDIGWVIPDFSASSGGHINIFRMAQFLQQAGYPRQCVTICAPHQWSSGADASRALAEYFGIEGIAVELGAEHMPPARFTFATGWQTAYWVAKFRGTLHRLYFVQDFEPAFFAIGSDYFLAEGTYKLGLTGVTAGTWLRDKLAAEYGMRTTSFGFSYDKALYRELPAPAGPAKRRVFFYARPVTPRRCFELGLLALRVVCEKLPDVEVVFAGWDVSDHNIPFPHQDVGQLDVADLPGLYATCDVALVLSGTNLSLLPMELAACGCPLVLNDDPQAKWGLPADCARYAPMQPEALALAVVELLEDRALSDAIAARARAFVEGTDWEAEAFGVAAFLKQLDAERA